MTSSRPQDAQTWITQFNLQTTPCLPLAFVHVHQMAPPRTVVPTSSCSLLLIYRPRKDKRLSWPSWLTNSGRFTHMSGHPSAVGRAQDSESSPVKDQRSAAEPWNELVAGETVSKMLVNLKNALHRNAEGSGTAIRNPHLGQITIKY